MSSADDISLHLQANSFFLSLNMSRINCENQSIHIKTFYLLVSSADRTFANRLDPDQARHVVGPDLDPTCLTL